MLLHHPLRCLYKYTLTHPSPIKNCAFIVFAIAFMDSTPTNSTSTRENEANLFREVQGIFDKFFKCLFSIIAFKITDAGEAFFATHSSVMTPFVLAVVVYFLAWLLATILQPHVKSSLPIITFIVLTIAGIVSLLSFTIIL